MLDRRVLMSGLAAGALQVGSGPSQVRPASRIEAEESYEEALQSVFTEFSPVGLAGGVVSRSGLDWAGVRGVRRQGSDERIALQDPWHLGSNTKAMTAALYGRLVDQGLVSWDQPIATILTTIRMDPSWERITSVDLMRHRAGVDDAQALGPVFFMTARSDPLALQHQRRALAQKILERPPGGAVGDYRYANANYILVGALIEQLTARPWEAVMRKEVFEPLGLASAGFGAPGQSDGQAPWGHPARGLSRGMDPRNSLSDNPAALGPAGTVHMSMQDYGRWLGLFLSDGDGWLQPHTLQRLGSVDPAPGVPYGLGWISPPPQTWSQGQILTHDGSNTYWYATAAVAPERGVAFMAFSNQGDGTAAQALRDLLIRAYDA